MAAGRREERRKESPNLVAVRKSVPSVRKSLHFCAVSASPWFVAGCGQWAVDSCQWAVGTDQVDVDSGRWTIVTCARCCAGLCLFTGCQRYGVTCKRPAFHGSGCKDNRTNQKAKEYLFSAAFYGGMCARLEYCRYLKADTETPDTRRGYFDAPFISPFSIDRRCEQLTSSCVSAEPNYSLPPTSRSRPT